MGSMRKIYYVPGLVSALIIPALFWYYGNQSVHPQYTVMDLGLPAKPKKGMTDLINSFEPYRNWNYKKIIVQPNTALQNQQYYISELKKLQVRNVKETGIEFVIGDQNNYQDFIALIDAMKISKQDTFGVDIEKTNHLFAVHLYEDPSKSERAYDVIGKCVLYTDDFKKNTLNLIRPETLINYVPKQTYYIIFGFLIFLHISMFSIKENLQLKKTFK